jgi:hypothetical protein
VTAVAVSGGVLAGADLTVSGEYFDRPTSTTEALALRFVAGDRVQFRAYLPALRVTSPDSVVVLPFGPAPLDDEQRLRRQLATDSGSSGNQGGEMSDQGQFLAQEDLDPLAFDSTATGVGDLRLGMATRLFGRPAGLYLMDLELDVKAPTADADAGLGTGEWDGRVGFSGERRFWTATAFAGLGWSHIGDPTWIDFSDPVDAYGGVESEPLGPGILISGWVESSSEIVPGAGGRTVLAFGLRNNRRNAWRLSATVGLTDAAEDFGIRLSFTAGGTKARSKALEVRR